MKDLTIILQTTTICFTGKYRRDLERNNWHYYETSRGDIFHFRKSEMVCVLENAVENGVK